MTRSQWSLGVLAAEQTWQEDGHITALVPHRTAQQEFCQGWNDYITHLLGNTTPEVPGIVSLRLERIERAYCRAVTKVRYAMHTEIEVLGILQRLQDKRRKLINKVYAYELTRRPGQGK